MGVLAKLKPPISGLGQYKLKNFYFTSNSSYLKLIIRQVDLVIVGDARKDRCQP